MKTILCYGDSNTWGIDNLAGGRVPYGMRWPNVLQQRLGGGCHVVEDGVNGRTTAEDDPADGCPWAKNGKTCLIPCLRAHFPLDLVIIMLGTNDLKTLFFTTVEQIARNVGDLAEMTRTELTPRQGSTPEILIAAPMVLGDTIEQSRFCAPFGGKRALAPSMKLEAAIRAEAKRRNCHFISAAAVARPDEADAVHFTREGHRLFGEAVARKVREILALA